MSSGWTARAYAYFRLGLGAYLVVHFWHLIPWGAEVFSSRGMIPDAETSPLTRLFPNLLALSDAPIAVTGLLATGAAAGVAIMLGWRDRLAALVAWYVLACLFGRNPLIANPSLPYVGLVLLGHAIMPSAGSWWAAWRGEGPSREWRMCPGVYGVVWVLMAIGYSYSGITKLSSPSWLDGTAFRALLENPLARPGIFRDLFLAAPDALLVMATGGALALEILFAPLALVPSWRRWIWLAMVGMHVGLVFLVDFADLSFGMLVLHAFTFDPQWIGRGTTKSITVSREKAWPWGPGKALAFAPSGSGGRHV